MTQRNDTERSQDTKTVENEILNSEDLDSVHGGSEPSLDFLGQCAGANKNIGDIPPQPSSDVVEKAIAAMRNARRNID